MTENSNDYLSTILEGVVEGIVVYSATSEVRFVNNKACEILGYAENELIGKSGAEFVHPDDVEIAHQAWLKLVASPGETASFQQRIVRSDKQVRWIDVRVKNALDDPQITGLVSYFRDITTEWELQEVLRRNQKVAMAGVAAGELAHDFNNLLAVIQGNLELGTLLYDRDLKSVIRSNQNAITATKKAGELISRYLATFRYEQRKRQPLELASVVKDQISLLENILPDHIVLNSADSLNVAEDPMVIYADVSQLQQVVMNLVLNARDAIGQSEGTITVSVKDESLMPEDIAERRLDLAVGEYVNLTVADTGCGIPADDVSSIFDAFFTTKTDGEGTGLGLSIVKNIAIEASGDVSVTSEPGRGTKFSVIFPRFFGAISEAEDRTTSITDLYGSGTLLLVDDDTYVLNFVATMLRGLGYTVVETSSYDTAVKRFDDRNLQFDAFIFDMRLKQQSGLELAQIASESRPDIPVILITGSLEDPVDPAPNVSHVIRKPFEIREMGEAVKQALRQ